LLPQDELVSLSFSPTLKMAAKCADCGARRCLFRLIGGQLVPAVKVRPKPRRVYIARIAHESDCPRWEGA